MRVCATDPVSGEETPDRDGHAFVIEGKGERARKSDFENEAKKRAGLDLVVEHPAEDFPTDLDPCA